MNETDEQESVQSHYSALTLHRKCAQAWMYRYGIGLSHPSAGPSPYRDFGSWWSGLRAAESLERGRALDSLKADPRTMKTVDDGPKFDQRTVTVQEVLKAADEWWHSRTQDVHEAWDAALGESLPRRISTVFERWQDQWATERLRERPIGVEVFWKRDLPRPEGDKAWDGAESLSDMPTMTLIGYVDEVYEDADRGLVVVRDDKTSKALGTQSAVDDMMDSQLQLYGWGLTPSLARWGVASPRAVAYDRTRSVRAKTPVLTKSGALSKQVTDFDLDTYREWVAAGQDFPGLKKDGSGAGTYEEDPAVTERLSTPAARSAWFQRTLVPVSRNVVRAHLRAAVDTTTDQWRTQRRTEITHEAARNLGPNCRFCDYAALCRAQMIGGPDGTYDLAEYGLVARDPKKTTLENGVLV